MTVAVRRDNPLMFHNVRNKLKNHMDNLKKWSQKTLFASYPSLSPCFPAHSWAQPSLNIIGYFPFLCLVLPLDFMAGYLLSVLLLPPLRQLL